MKRGDCRRGGPPWWPEGEPWPPRRGRFRVHSRARGRFFRWVAVAAIALVALAVTGIFAVIRVIAARYGFAGPPAAIPSLVALVVAGVIVTVMLGAMRRFASPLESVMDAADRVAEGDYGTRVQEYGPPPMRALAHSFNTMTERLQNADRLRRDLMADVAHELRTPLSVLQGRLEGLLDGVYSRDDAQISQLLDETHVLSRLIEDLRTLALSEAGALQLQKEPADVVGLVQDVVSRMQTEATRASMTLHVTASTENAVLDIDAVRIREVLTNLLSNALRHNPSGGAVTVSVRDTADGLAVSVTDTGQGMPPEEVSGIFDRFSKGAASRGSGLGLTIAKGIITAHGGEISASSRVGEGTAVTFTLPRVDAP